MATASTGRNLCNTCSKAKGISKCEGCAKIFCYIHFGDHRQELNQQLEDVEVSRDVFRQTLTEQTTNPAKQTLVQQINDWERDAIERIRQTADQARQSLLQHTAKYISSIEVKLNTVTDQLRQSRQENDFVETDLQHWKQQLIQLNTELCEPSHIKLRHDSKPLVTRIDVDISEKVPRANSIGANTRWETNGITIAGGSGKGDRPNQIYYPGGIYIDNEDQVIYVADYGNHRIVGWKCNATSGHVVAGGNGVGNRPDQLSSPTKVILDKQSDSFIIADLGNKRVVRWPRYSGATGQVVMANVHCIGLANDSDGYYYVPDFDKHEVRRWKLGESVGIVVAGGNGKGNRLNQLDSPTDVLVDEDQTVYVSDFLNHRVMKWTKNAQEGTIVAGDQGLGNSLSQLSSPRGVIVDQVGNIYVADSDNNRVMRWRQGDTTGSIIIHGNGKGAMPDQLSCPIDLSFDRQGNLYVADCNNHRVQRFDIDSNST